MSENKELTDDEVSKVAKDCGFEVIGIKRFKNDTMYYLKETEEKLK